MGHELPQRARVQAAPAGGDEQAFSVPVASWLAAEVEAESVGAPSGTTSFLLAADGIVSASKSTSARCRARRLPWPQAGRVDESTSARLRAGAPPPECGQGALELESLGACGSRARAPRRAPRRARAQPRKADQRADGGEATRDRRRRGRGRPRRAPRRSRRAGADVVEARAAVVEPGRERLEVEAVRVRSPRRARARRGSARSQAEPAWDGVRPSGPVPASTLPVSSFRQQRVEHEVDAAALALAGADRAHHALTAGTGRPGDAGTRRCAGRPGAGGASCRSRSAPGEGVARVAPRPRDSARTQ